MKEFKRIWVRFKDENDYCSKEGKLLDLIKNKEGKTELIIYLKDEDKCSRVIRKIHLDDDVFDKFKDEFGEENIKCEPYLAEDEILLNNVFKLKKKFDLIRNYFHFNDSAAFKMLMLLELENISRSIKTR